MENHSKVQKENDVVYKNFDEVVVRQYNDNIIEYGIILGASERVLLIKTGQGGSIYGYNNKYLTLAWTIHEKYEVSVMVSSNPYDRTDSLGKAIELLKERMTDSFEIYYMGVSNGAILGARYGYCYPEIKKMLLVNGPLMINWLQTKKGIERFRNERVTFVYGSEDPSYDYRETISLIQSESEVILVIVEGADHNFKGMENCYGRLVENYLLNENEWSGYRDR